MQERRAAARHSRDHERPRDILRGDLRMLTSVALDLQAIAQIAHDRLPGGETAKEIEPRFGPQRIEQAPESLEKCRVFERPPIGRATGAGEQMLSVKGDEPTPRGLDQARPLPDERADCRVWTRGQPHHRLSAIIASVRSRDMSPVQTNVHARAKLHNSPVAECCIRIADRPAPRTPGMARQTSRCAANPAVHGGTTTTPPN